MRETMSVLKAISDESRVRILMALRGRELCVCQIIELLELAQSTVSKHMSILKQARLVDSRKNGRWIYYRLIENESTNESRAALEMLGATLTTNQQVQDDQKSLKRILALDPEELCRRQVGN